MGNASFAAPSAHRVGPTARPLPPPLEQIAVAGELFSAEAKRRSLAGMLIEGSCRDTETIARVRVVVVDGDGG